MSNRRSLSIAKQRLVAIATANLRVGAGVGLRRRKTNGSTKQKRKSV